MAELPPRLLAYLDQHAAELRDLVQMARDHRGADGCTVPHCPGVDVFERIRDMDCHHQLGLFAFAIAELAETEAGRG